MANRYKKNNPGLRILCVVLALIIVAGLTIGGLELWGKGKQKPSNWGKKSMELAPVTISFTDDAPFGIAQAFGKRARAYPLATIAANYPSTKRAIATCVLPEGGTPDRYEWQITGGSGLSVKTVNADGSSADVTARSYFSGSATLTARAYRENELRGIGSIKIYAYEPNPDPDPDPKPDPEPEPEPEPMPSDKAIDVYYIKNGSEEYQRMLSDFRAFSTKEYGFTLNFCEFIQAEACYEREPDFAIFLDENNTIANSGHLDILQDINTTCFFYNCEVDEALGYFLTEEELAPEGIESALQTWATENGNEVNALVGDLAMNHQGVIEQIIESNSDYSMESISDHDNDWESALNSGNSFNCIILSSSAELPTVIDTFDTNGIVYEDYLWIICDVREEEAQKVSKLISEGASVCAYKKVSHFDLIFDAIYDIMAGKTLSKNIDLYTYETFT